MEKWSSKEFQWNWKQEKATIIQLYRYTGKEKISWQLNSPQGQTLPTSAFCGQEPCHFCQRKKPVFLHELKVSFTLYMVFQTSWYKSWDYYLTMACSFKRYWEINITMSCAIPWVIITETAFLTSHVRQHIFCNGKLVLLYTN